jgi:hypothetical protein
MLRAFLLAFALLFAQQVALAHAITHQGPACELHAAMGAASSAPHTAFSVDALPERPRARLLRLASLSAPTPSCRGPPPVSPS